MASERFGKRCLLTLGAAAALALAPGCGLLQRSERAQNVEEENPPPPLVASSRARTAPEPPRVASSESSDDDGAETPSRIDWDTFTDPSRRGTEPAPQTVAARPKPGAAGREGANPTLKAASELFERAAAEQEAGAFQKASELWHRFLDQYVGLPEYEQASYNSAFCLFSLGRADEAVEPLKHVILTSNDAALTNDARILLAESLIQGKKNDEALATTYDVLPNRAAEDAAGIERNTNAVGTGGSATEPSLAQKIRLYTIRGRIFAAFGRDEEAHSALEKAKLLLLHSKKGQLSQKDMRFLSANYAWRQLEVQALTCKQRVTVPQRLSEAEFLAYADAYYGCAEPARHIYCTVIASASEQVKGQAQSTYRNLVEGPLELRDHLPP
ncbi:MAG: CDC27 family protein, partial [Deltaproteobacteria bacterium]|nr:CDC27 family protein [Deltaproteobacteria bacterium]